MSLLLERYRYVKESERSSYWMIKIKKKGGETTQTGGDGQCKGSKRRLSRPGFSQEHLNVTVAMLVVKVALEGERLGSTAWC